MTNVLHIAPLEKFIPPFIDFIRKEFPNSGQKVITYGDIEKYKYELGEDSVHLDRKGNKIARFFSRYARILGEMNRSDKIILHGLFDNYLVFVLFLNPWLLNKCYWIIWGGDLYKFNRELYLNTKFFKLKEFFRKSVISRLGYLVTYLSGDVEIARKVYGAKGEHIECIMYLSNVFTEKYANKEFDCDSGDIKILLGNSADPTNNHLDALKKLLPIKNENIKIIIPLSYGNKDNADIVMQCAQDMFGDKVRFLVDFMPYSDYLNLLETIDVAIFNHDRQQAMGNTISLVGMGKKVYIKKGTSQWELFKTLAVSVFNIEDIVDLDNLSSNINLIDRNQEIVRNYFSKKNLKEQLSKIILIKE
ncbi:TDP-N-acetylfucosamine:lipid II N-acetylfucosaminyltransferase [Vibrio sp. DNB22_10_4]